MPNRAFRCLRLLWCCFSFCFWITIIRVLLSSVVDIDQPASQPESATVAGLCWCWWLNRNEWAAWKWKGHRWSCFLEYSQAYYHYRLLHKARDSWKTWTIPSIHSLATEDVLCWTMAYYGQQRKTRIKSICRNLFVWTKNPCNHEGRGFYNESFRSNGPPPVRATELYYHSTSQLADIRWLILDNQLSTNTFSLDKNIAKFRYFPPPIGF